jgi:hypothetical protein
MPLASHGVIAATPLRRVGDALRAGGYDGEACERVQTEVSRLGRPSPSTVAGHLDEPPVLKTLLSLLALGLPVTEEDARAALGPGTDDLLRLGVLHREEGRVRAELSILPAEGFYTTRDFNSVISGRPIGADYVLGIGPATQTLASLAVRRRARLTLDLGTGQGYLALRASGHSERVIATDVNPRALSAAALSFALSGCGNITLREGSFFEPVRGEGGFDLIVSNPPFVIQPPTERVCFTAGVEGDGCMEHIVREGPGLLAEGGYLCVMGNWHHPDERAWEARPAAWAGEAGCDLWLIRSRTYTPRAYAREWIAELTSGGASAGLSLDMEAWLSYYRRLGIGAITLGAVILRRRRGKNWARAESLPLESIRGEAGPQIERVFEHQTRLLAGTDPLDLPLVVAGGGEIEQRLRPGTTGGLTATTPVLRQTAGFPMPVEINPGAIALLSRLDGKTTPRRVLEEMAAARGVEAGGLIAAARPLVEALYRQGHVREGVGG